MIKAISVFFSMHDSQSKPFTHFYHVFQRIETADRLLTDLIAKQTNLLSLGFN